MNRTRKGSGKAVNQTRKGSESTKERQWKGSESNKERQWNGSECSRQGSASTKEGQCRGPAATPGSSRPPRSSLLIAKIPARSKTKNADAPPPSLLRRLLDGGVGGGSRTAVRQRRPVESPSPGPVRGLRRLQHRKERRCFRARTAVTQGKAVFQSKNGSNARKGGVSEQERQQRKERRCFWERLKAVVVSRFSPGQPSGQPSGAPPDNLAKERTSVGGHRKGSARPRKGSAKRAARGRRTTVQRGSNTCWH